MLTLCRLIKKFSSYFVTWSFSNMQAYTANPNDNNPVHSLPHYYFKSFFSSLRCRDNEGCFAFIPIPFFKAFLNSAWFFLLYTAVSVSISLHLSFLSASSPVVSVFTSFYFAPFVFSVIINVQCTFNCSSTFYLCWLPAMYVRVLWFNRPSFTCKSEDLACLPLFKFLCVSFLVRYHIRAIFLKLIIWVFLLYMLYHVVG